MSLIRLPTIILSLTAVFIILGVETALWSNIGPHTKTKVIRHHLHGLIREFANYHIYIIISLSREE